MYHSTLVADVDHPEHARRWVTGLVVIAATIIGFFGFARISRGWTLGLSTAILIGLLVFFWIVGRRSGSEPKR